MSEHDPSEPRTALEFGPFTGIVAERDDPEQSGRLRLRIPAKFGDQVHPAWARPMNATYGDGPEGTVGRLIVPEPGAVVFVMFLDGNPETPLWMPGTWGRGPREIGHDPQHPPIQGAYPTKILHWRSRTGATLIETGDGDVTYANKRRDLSLKLEEGRLKIDVRPSAKVVVNEGGSDQCAARKGDAVKFGSLSVTLGPSGVTAVLWHPPDGGPPQTLSAVPTTIVGTIDEGSASFLIGD